MTKQILITSPYPEFTKMVQDISRELGSEVIVVEAVLEDAAQKVAKICELEQIEVIVSRGGAAEAIKKIVDIPLITAEVNDFDILKALLEARQYSAKIGFLGFDYPLMPYEFQILVELIGVEVKQFLYKNKEDIIKQIEIAKDKEIEVIVGGGNFGVRLAQEKGIHGVLIRSSRRTVFQALQKAKWVVEVRNNDKKSAKQLEKILELSHGGIAAIDQNQLVTVFNPVAEKIFAIPKSKILKQPITKWKANKNIGKVLRSGEETFGSLVKVGDTNLIVNRAQIQVDNENYGTVITFQEVAELQQLEHSVRRQMYSHGLIAKFGFADIVAESQVMKKCLERAKKFAVTDSTILITGESGTGKELFAQSIHNISSRKGGPFVAVNCAALPQNLLESELFGYEEGAFTGAKKGGKPGYFELAHSGTIFLDEIGTLPKTVQALLLRVLQERELFRLGGDKVIPIDVRVIAATNEDLSAAVRGGEFRVDLFYRLNVLNIKIPPLRERVGDIPLLVEYFIAVFNQRFNKQVQHVSAELLEWLSEYTWPGNIRELSNCIERLVILTEGANLDLELLDLDKSNLEVTGEQGDKQQVTINMGTLAEMEEQIVSKLLQVYQGNKAEVAELLGISRTTLWKRLKKLGKHSSQMLKK